VTSNLKKII